MTKKAKRGPARPIKSPERKVGRGKPPKQAQYKKGQTGNKLGRPKGTKNLSTYIMEAARKPVTAIIDGKKRVISTLSATTYQLATKAAGGDHKASVKLLDWVDKIESRAAEASPTQYPLSEADLDVLKAVYERMKLCEPEGSTS